MARAKIDMQVRTINPAIAKAMLGNMVVNRAIDPNRVKRYQGAMERGEWNLGDPIMLNCDGSIIEGQHRLHAVIKADTAVPFVIIEGYDPEKTFGIVGSGKERTARDWFSIRGDKNPGVRAAACRLIQTDRDESIHDAGNRRTITPTQLLTLREEVREELDESMAAVPNSMGKIVSRAIMVYCHYTFAKRDKGLADLFMDGLATGEQLRATDPVHVLREQFLGAKRERVSSGSQRQQVVIGTTRLAWNLVRAGKTSKRIQYRTDRKEFPGVD